MFWAVCHSIIIWRQTVCTEIWRTAEKQIERLKDSPLGQDNVTVDAVTQRGDWVIKEVNKVLDTDWPSPLWADNHPSPTSLMSQVGWRPPGSGWCLAVSVGRRWLAAYWSLGQGLNVKKSSALGEYIINDGSAKCLKWTMWRHFLA